MSYQIVNLLTDALLETLYMVAVSAALGTSVGLLLGVVLATAGKDDMLPQPGLHRVLSAVVNVGRSVPFIILVVAIIPFTRLLTGTTIGTTAAIVPLVIGVIPFFARVAETAIREVDPSLIEAARAMGARPLQIVGKVLLPEALPGLIRGLTLTLVTLVGYSAMVGAIGGGGLGDLGIRYGYQRFRPEIMAAVVIVLVVVVQAVQMTGDVLARRLYHRMR